MSIQGWLPPFRVDRSDVRLRFTRGWLWRQGPHVTKPTLGYNRNGTQASRTNRRSSDVVIVVEAKGVWVLPRGQRLQSLKESLGRSPLADGQIRS